MPDLSSTAPLPARRPALVLRELGDLGQRVVKNGDGGFYDLDEQSYFLLTRLDGRSSAEEVRAAYQARFAEPLAAEELAEFVSTARAFNFLEEDPPSPSSPTPPPAGGRGDTPTALAPEGGGRDREGRRPPAPGPSGNSLLFFR